jgi:hypothetical protein
MSLKSGNYQKTVQRIDEAIVLVAGKTVDVSNELISFQLEFADLSSQVQVLDASQVAMGLVVADLSSQVIDLENLTFTGAGLEDVSAGSSSGSYARINLNGTFYKLDLLDDE